MNPLFADEETCQTILWDDVFALFQPVTPYGRRFKNAMIPEVSREDSTLQYTLRDLEQDIANLNAAHVDVIRTVLRRVPDVDPVLACLSRNEAPIGAKDALLLKQFALAGIALGETLSTVLQTGKHASLDFFVDTAAFSTLRDLFGNEASPTFALQDIGNHAYRSARAAVLAAKNTLRSTKNTLFSEWASRIGVVPNEQGRIHVSRPDAVTLTKLKAMDGLGWQSDTPFESAFVVLQNDAWRLAEMQLDEAQDELDRCVRDVLQQLTHRLLVELPTWKRFVETICNLDVRLARVAMCLAVRGCVPKIGQRIRMHNARHVIIETRLASAQKPYVPITLELDSPVAVISGSNMGGKSVTLALVALCQMLLQHGLPVPAEAYEAPLVDCIRVMASVDSAFKHGLSAFGQEVWHIAQVWELRRHHACLICLDEPGKSTNPREGEALVQGIIDDLLSETSADCLLVASHFPGVATRLDVNQFVVRGLRRELLDDSTTAVDGLLRLRQLEAAMDYTLVRRHTGDMPMEALTVAAWLGLPKKIDEFAKQFLHRTTSFNTEGDDLELKIKP